MKKAFALLLALSLAMGACACSASAEQGRVMASFYPMYIFALNVFEGVADISLDCMTAPETGCLHDYQLMVSDMMKLSEADMLIVCGAGMESYLDDVTELFPKLTVVDCSQGIELLADEDHHHDGEEETYNAHTWLDARNAALIVRTIADAACARFPADAERLQSNAEAYIARLEALDGTLKEMLRPVKGEKIVTFHEAFPYFARAYGLEIAAVISEDHEDSISPAQLAAVIETVRAAGIPPLFTEPQYSAVTAYAIAAETGAAIYELDPLASGDFAPDAYEKGMLADAAILLEAFSK